MKKKGKGQKVLKVSFIISILQKVKEELQYIPLDINEDKKVKVSTFQVKKNNLFHMFKDITNASVLFKKRLP